jgi:hypothetical protein
LIFIIPLKLLNFIPYEKYHEMGICLTTIHKGIAILTLQISRIYSFIITIDIGLLEQLSRSP